LMAGLEEIFPAIYFPELSPQADIQKLQGAQRSASD
jgi:hypothetical protein